MSSAGQAQNTDEDRLIQAMDRMETDQPPMPTAQSDVLDEALLTAKHLVPAEKQALDGLATISATPRIEAAPSKPSAAGLGNEDRVSRQEPGRGGIREPRANSGAGNVSDVGGDDLEAVRKYVALSPETQPQVESLTTRADIPAHPLTEPQAKLANDAKSTPKVAMQKSTPYGAVWRRDQTTPGRMVSKAIAEAFADVPIEPQQKSATPASARPATVSSGVGSALLARSGMPGQSTPTGDAATIASLRQQLAVERRITRRLQDEIDALGNKDKFTELRGEIEILTRKLRERDNEIAMLRRDLHIMDRKFTEETRVDDAGYSRTDKLRQELRAANDAVSTLRKELAERDARYRKMEAREIKLLSVLPDLYFKLFGANDEDTEDAQRPGDTTKEGASEPKSAKEMESTAQADQAPQVPPTKSSDPAVSTAPPAPTAPDPDTIISTVQHVLATLQRDNEHLKAECASLKQEGAKTSSELVKAKQDNSIILRSLENTKRRHGSEIKKYKDMIRDLEERIISFANDYELLLREYKAEVLRNTGAEDGEAQPGPTRATDRIPIALGEERGPEEIDGTAEFGSSALDGGLPGEYENEHFGGSEKGDAGRKNINDTLVPAAAGTRPLVIPERTIGPVDQ